MKNTDEVTFWIFGDTSVPKLAVLGFMFFAGLVVGFMLGRPRKKATSSDDFAENNCSRTTDSRGADEMSDEDREYIR